MRKLFTKTKGGLPIEVPLEPNASMSAVRGDDFDGHGHGN